MAKDERIARSNARRESREERVENWVDRNVSRRGLRPRYAAYLLIAVTLVTVLVFGIVERIADPETYPTIWAAWWWAIQTVTTVGYGDVVPQATAGKMVAAFVMVGGLAFLSILTATVTSGFIARRERKTRERGDDPMMQQLVVLSENLVGLSDRMESLESALRKLRTDSAGRVDGDAAAIIHERKPSR